MTTFNIEVSTVIVKGMHVTGCWWRWWLGVLLSCNGKGSFFVFEPNEVFLTCLPVPSASARVKIACVYATASLVQSGRPSPPASWIWWLIVSLIFGKNIVLSKQAGGPGGAKQLLLKPCLKASTY